MMPELLDPALFIPVMGVFGLLIGSFMNVVVYRLPVIMEREWRHDCQELLGCAEEAPPPPLSLARPRSRCPHCGAQLGALENIPVLSYLVQGGRCRHCGKAISLRYPLVELAAGAAGAYAAWFVSGGALTLVPVQLINSLAVAGFVWALMVLALIDYDTKLLPDSITQPLLWFGIALGYLGLLPHPLTDAVLGAMLGYLCLWSIYWVFKLVTGKEGFGYGDFKLLAALGAWLGWQALPMVLVLSSAVGGTIAIVLLLSGRMKRGEAMPFGPYLAIAGIIALFKGRELMDFALGGPLP